MLRSDELPHAPGPDPRWAESWSFDFALPDGQLGGLVEIGLRPNQASCWYRAVLVGEGRELVVVLDDEVPLPRPPSLEIRAEGLWADHIIEEPFDHVSVGCEAFGLRLDDPADALLSAPLGERVAFGLDLGWETDPASDCSEYRDRRTPEAVRGYRLQCRVVGEVLVGRERIELDTHGGRQHVWGSGSTAFP